MAIQWKLNHDFSFKDNVGTKYEGTLIEFKREGDGKALLVFDLFDGTDVEKASDEIIVAKEISEVE